MYVILTLLKGALCSNLSQFKCIGRFFYWPYVSGLLTWREKWDLPVSLGCLVQRCWAVDFSVKGSGQIFLDSPEDVTLCPFLTASSQPPNREQQRLTLCNINYWPVCVYPVWIEPFFIELLITKHAHSLQYYSLNTDLTQENNLN